MSWTSMIAASATINASGTLIRASALWYLTSIGNTRNPNNDLDTEHEAIGELDIPTGLIAADKPGDRRRKNHALIEDGVSGGTQASTSVAKMKADVRTRPVIGRDGRGLDWHHRLPGDNTPNPYDWGGVGLCLVVAGIVAYAIRRRGA